MLHRFIRKFQNSKDIKTAQLVQKLIVPVGGLVELRWEGFALGCSLVDPWEKSYRASPL